VKSAYCSVHIIAWSQRAVISIQGNMLTLARYEFLTPLNIKHDCCCSQQRKKRLADMAKLGSLVFGFFFGTYRCLSNVTLTAFSSEYHVLRQLIDSMQNKTGSML
jgi:hypothetical protein